MIARLVYRLVSNLLSSAMSRLWVRLSLAFSAIAFISVSSILVVITVFTFATGQRNWSTLDELQRPGGTVEQLINYYNSRTSWRNVDVFLAGVQSSYRVTPQFSVSFAFTDADGRLVYTSHPTRRDPDTVVSFNEHLPINVNNETVGYLNVMQIELPDALDWQNEFLDWLGKWLWLIVLAGLTVGVISGVLISRTLAAPMSHLSQAAKAIGDRKLSSRVQASGTVEVIELANAFNDMAQGLEEAEALRRNMVADVAHELRTPLTVLQGNLRAIIDGVYPMDTSEIASLYDQTLVLRRLVTDLHELSQAEARKLALNMQPLDMEMLLSRLVSTFEPVVEERQITIHSEIEPALPVVRGDSTRISQVLNNLLDNALRHTPEGGHISIHASLSGEHLRLSVSDNGQGIALEHLPYVFERFYRADRARARQTGGSGLGLAIARAIIESHQGTICVHSPGLDQGTTFTIDLPLVEKATVPQPLALSSRSSR